MISKMKGIATLALLLLAANAQANNFKMTGTQCEQPVEYYWIYQGNTASGYGYYKDDATGHYLHHDMDCNGPYVNYDDGDDSLPAWIINDRKPSTTRTSDLDNSGDCTSWNEIYSTSAVPISGEWTHVFFSLGNDDGTVETAMFTVRDIGQQVAPPPSNFKMTGRHCDQPVEYYWIHQGYTATAAGNYGYYKDEATGLYLHHDKDCNGPDVSYYSHYNGGSSPSWIINDIKPSTTRTSDLDNSQDCSAYHHLASTSAIPVSGDWNGACEIINGNGQVIDSNDDEDPYLVVTDIRQSVAPSGWKGAGTFVDSSASSATSLLALALAFLASAMLMA